MDTENCKDEIVETEEVNEYQQQVFDNWKNSSSKKVEGYNSKKVSGIPSTIINYNAGRDCRKP